VHDRIVNASNALAFGNVMLLETISIASWQRFD